MADLAEYTPVDLSKLPAPAVIEELSYEAIYAAMLDELQARLPTFDATVESDPAVMLLQVAAYREFLLRARVNDAARALMPAFAVGADLDQLAALFGVTRLVLSPGDPAKGIAATLESDDEFRRRMVLAPEGYSVAGPEGAYIYHALTAAADVLDASATSPAPGEVLVTILSRTGSGAAAPALLATVAGYLSADSRRPMTDAVTVQSAQILPFTVEAAVTTFPGPDASIVLATGRQRLDAYIAVSHRLGRDVTRSGIFAALHIAGVVNVTIAQPAGDLIVDRTQASYCIGITVAYAGTGE